MQLDSERTVVVLGTGGTIAGAALRPGDNVGYRAAQIGADALVAAVPALGGLPIEVEQVAQVDSKDMGPAVWRTLAARIDAHLRRPEVAGIVVTHGTDTLEETAYLLQRVLAPARPVVLTAAMRPATALLADGPQNLLDAVQVALAAGARGVVAVVAGRVHGACDVRKVHPYRLDAFDSGDAGPIAHIEEGRLRCHRSWPTAGGGFGLDRLPALAEDWPWVEIVTSHAGARGAGVRALVGAGVEGLVVAATGNGSVHQDLTLAIEAAQAGGLPVLRSTRCGSGAIVDPAAGAMWRSAASLTPAQARIALTLELLARRAEGPPQ